MTSVLLNRAPLQERPVLGLPPPLALTLGRAHEICGPARHTLALVLAAVRPGPVLWIRPDWEATQLTGAGLTRWIDPGRLLFVAAPRSEDVLWCLEEALRSGTLPTVVAEVPEPPALTPVRRLHLAAEQGMAAVQAAPLALLLTPGEGGAAGVETRWSLHPAPRAEKAPAAWMLDRLRARQAPPAIWRTEEVERDGRLSLVVQSIPEPAPAPEPDRGSVLKS